MNKQPEIPVSFHRAETDLPFVTFAEGIKFQLLKVDVPNAFWAVRVRFDPGVTIPKHKHTGDVHAFTIAGSWKYLEYPEVNTPGSYLYEPSGAIHTLHVLEENEGVTDVFFVVRGANLDLDEYGNVENILDAGAVLAFYLAQCEAEGHKKPDVIGL